MSHVEAFQQISFASPQTNVTDYVLESSQLRHNPEYIFWFRNVVQFSFTIFAPFVCLAYFNVGTAVLLKRRSRHLRRMLQQASR